MIDKKKAAPPQNSQIIRLLNNVNYNKKISVVKQYKANAYEYRDEIIGTFDYVDEALAYMLRQKEGGLLNKAENCFYSKNHVLRIFLAEKTVGYQGQAGCFSLERRSAVNTFIRLPVWRSIENLPGINKCCAKLLTMDARYFLTQSPECEHCALPIEQLAGQFAYQQSRNKKSGYDELVFLDELQALGLKLDLSAALQHAVILSDGFLYSYCNSGEVRYE